MEDPNVQSPNVQPAIAEAAPEAHARHEAPNPLLARVNKMPPETFRLPSGGVLYTNGELDPDVVNGEVVIYPMTTVDEITMRSPDMLFQGTAIEKVFTRCIPDVKKPMELLSKDVDYLLICLRMVTYGNVLDIYWTCPECHNDKEILPELKPNEGEEHVVEQRREGEDGSRELLNVKPTYEIDLNRFLQNTVPLDVNSNELNFTLTSGENVKLKPSTIGEMIKLYQYDLESISTPEEMSDFIVDSLLAVIHSVDNVTKREFIREWALQCAAPIINEIQDNIQAANDWGTSEKYSFKCKKCHYTSETDIPLNPIHFFTAPSTNRTKR